MVSLTLKVILHVAENDSKYRDVATLSEHNRAVFNMKFAFRLWLKLSCFGRKSAIVIP